MGVGRRLAERLAVSGIRTAWDLREHDPKRLRKRFSVVLARTALELRGTPCLELNAVEQPRQRIMTSRSFGKTTGVKRSFTRRCAATPSAVPKNCASKAALPAPSYCF
ncbi:hypothetical protein HAALTHF_46770n [Vreelandella aquamarina]|nr:hypothetical protein HAALTHF_46770n [Halomonas axialensis]